MTHRVDPVDQFMALVTQVSHELTGLWIFHRASSDKLASMHDSDDWVAREREQLDVKDFYKVKGGALFSFRDYLTKVTIGALAIILESASISAKQIAGRKVDLWDARWDALPYVLDMRRIAALNNVLKHNQGVIQRSSSRSSRFLVDKCGIRDGQRVVLVGLDLPEQLFRAYSFLLHLVAVLTDIWPRALRGPEAMLRRAFSGLLPSFTGKRRRRRTTASSGRAPKGSLARSG